jgi:hypothetical protein
MIFMQTQRNSQITCKKRKSEKEEERKQQEDRKREKEEYKPVRLL